MTGSNHKDYPFSKKRSRKPLSVTIRWIHVYLSMFGLMALLFFAITGITVNNPDWFSSGRETIHEFEGKLPIQWLGPTPEETAEDFTAGVEKLSIVEQLRENHSIRGFVSEFDADEYQLMIGFNGPAYMAYATIERETGDYELTETLLGFIAILNYLHKGRDTGEIWSWVIDISAMILVLSSISGFYLILGLKNRRSNGIKLGIAGVVILLLAYSFFVP